MKESYGHDGEHLGDIEEWPEDAADVACPHCGASVAITLDPAGGSNQEYIEDCEVCCRPWVVRVHYAAGCAEVSVEPA